MECTVQITFVGFTPFRNDMVNLLKGFGYDHKKHGLESLYQSDRARDFYAVFNNTDSAWNFSELGQQVFKSCTVIFSDISSERINLRVHWLPMYVDNDYVERVFSHLGKVVRVVSDTVSMQGLNVTTGVRTVTMQVNERIKNTIPHKISTSDGFTMLVTCRGRMPLCLRCNSLGHVRSDCGAGRTVQEKPSYAMVVRKGRNTRCLMRVRRRMMGFC